MDPYGYVYNNPINLIDPTGMGPEDWVINSKVDREGNKTVKITFIGAIYNDSGQDIDMNDFSNAIESQLKETFEGTYSESRPVSKTIGQGNLSQKINYEEFKDFKVELDVKLRVINNKSDLKDNEHFLQISKPSDLPKAYGEVNKVGGKEIYFNANKVANMINGKDRNTIPHELGHTLGLRHINVRRETIRDFFGGNSQYIDSQQQSRNQFNVMFSGGSQYMNDRTSTQINSSQMNRIIRNYNSGGMNIR